MRNLPTRKVPSGHTKRLQAALKDKKKRRSIDIRSKKEEKKLTLKQKKVIR